jgi:hypothetical protein
VITALKIAKHTGFRNPALLYRCLSTPDGRFADVGIAGTPFSGRSAEGIPAPTCQTARERVGYLETRRDSPPDHGKPYRARTCRSRAALTE